MKNNKLNLSNVSCSSFDNTKIELVHQIRKQLNYGMCDIKVALLKSNYNVEAAIGLLSISKYRIASDNLKEICHHQKTIPMNGGTDEYCLDCGCYI